MRTRHTVRAVVGTLALVAGLCAGTTSAAAKGGSPVGDGGGVGAQFATPYQTITSTGPLTEIVLGNELSCQVSYGGNSYGTMYPPTTRPADCGTFLATGGTLYGPSFSAHGGTATAFAAYQSFTPVSQTGPSGSGTLSDPYIVTTVVNAGTTGLRLTRVDTYVTGQTSYHTSVVVTNTGSTARTGVVYHGFDCYINASDSGLGFAYVSPTADTAQVGCAGTTQVGQLVSLSAGSKFIEDRYNVVWAAISSQASLPNTCQCVVPHDNAAALSWNVSVPASGSVLRSFLTDYPLRGPAITPCVLSGPCIAMRRTIEVERLLPPD